MKKLLFILILINAAFMVKAQDAYPYQLPEYTAVENDSTDVLYIDDSGIDKHIEMPTLIQLVSDSTNQLRGELADTAAQLRSEIAGGGAWSVSGDVVTLTSADDSVGIGLAPSERFSVNGNISGIRGKFNRTEQDTARFNTGGYILSPTSSRITLRSLSYNGFTFDFSDGTFTNALYPNHYFDWNTSNLTLYAMQSAWVFNASYVVHSSDTLATRAYARSYGGGSSDSTWTEITVSDTAHLAAMEATDSVYLEYLAGDPDNWLFLTSTGAIDTGTTAAASWGNETKLRRLGKYLRDKQGGELMWGHVEDGKIVWTRGLPEARHQLNAITGEIEMLLRYVYRERVNNIIQYFLFGIILVVLGWLIKRNLGAKLLLRK